MVAYSHKHRLLGMYRTWRGDWRGAATHYKHLLKSDPANPKLLHSYFSALYKSKQFERVISGLDDLEKSQNLDETLGILRLRSHLKLRNYDKLEELYEAFTSSGLKHIEAQKVYADSLLARGEYERALKEYENILESAKEMSSSLQQAHAYHLLGYISGKLGKQTEANVYYDLAVSHSQSSLVTALGIGALHQRQGFLEQAVEAYKEQLETTPENGELYFRLGQLYSKQLKTADAAKAYKEFVLHDSVREKEGFKLNEKMIVFDAYMGRNYACSPRAIYEEMLADKKYKDFTFVWVLRSSSLTRFWKLYLNPRTKIVRYKSRDYFRAYARAKYWVTNSRIAFVLKTNPNQVYVQCWHGTPLKKIGHSVILRTGDTRYDKDGLAELYDSETKRFDYLLSPSQKATEFLSEAFDLKGLNKEDVVLQEGYPRNDFLHNFTDKDVSRVKKKLGIPKGKKVLLYAPTWRDDQHDSERGYTYKTEADFDYLKERLSDDWVILFRAHYFVANGFNFDKYKGFIYNVSDVNDVNDLYIASNVLMTDYSSVFFDYANLRRPIIFFMYDLEHYQKDLRGFYIDLKTLPGKIITKEQEIVDILNDLNSYNKSYSDLYQNFCGTYTYLDDGKAATRVVEKVMII